MFIYLFVCWLFVKFCTIAPIEKLKNCYISLFQYRRLDTSASIYEINQGDHCCVRFSFSRSISKKNWNVDNLEQKDPFGIKVFRGRSHLKHLFYFSENCPFDKDPFDKKSYRIHTKKNTCDRRIFQTYELSKTFFF